MALCKPSTNRTSSNNKSRRSRTQSRRQNLSRNKRKSQGQKKRKSQGQKKRKSKNQKSRSQKRIKTLKGGAIPFSEYGLVYDNASYGIQSAQRLFSDNSPTVINNAKQPVNPNPTAQFNRTHAFDSDVKGPNLGAIFRSAYSS
jgi:hypothetical protein